MKKQKRTARILGAIALAFNIIMLAVYIVAGRNQFSPNLSMTVIGGVAAGTVLGVIAVLLTKREVFFAAYFAEFFAILSYISTQLTLLANIIYDVDGSSVPSELVFITVSGLLATILHLIIGAAVLREKKEEADV